MYKALFALAYYGLMRVAEISHSDHVIKAKDIYIATNKKKIRILLYSSKTHDKRSRPQEITISAKEKMGNKQRNFCPFELMRRYMKLRNPAYMADDEQFFIFRDRSPVTPQHVRNLLTKLLIRLNLNPACYGRQSMRIGCASDLEKIWDHSPGNTTYGEVEIKRGL